MTVVSKQIVDNALWTVYNIQTEATYRSALREFVGRRLTQVEIQGIVDGWANNARSTINVRKSALEHLVRVAHEAGICERDVLRKVVFPKGRRARRRLPVSDREMKLLEGATKTAAERLLLYLLHDTGIRVGNAAIVTFGQLKEDRFAVEAKADSEVTIYTTRRLRALAEVVQGDRPDDDLVFGRPAYTKKIERWLRSIGNRCGVSVSPHQFRHRFVTRIVDATEDISAATRIVGHKSIETTQGYRHHNQDKLQRLVESLTGGE